MKAYEESIHGILANRGNAVYLYVFGEIHYYAVRGVAYKKEWLVIFGERGLMETAFPPEDIDDYLERRGFILLDRIEEVLKWTKEVES